MGVDGGEDLAVGRSGRDQGSPAFHRHAAVGGAAPEQVDAHQFRHVGRPRVGADGRQRALLHDGARFQHHEAVGEGGGLDRVVCHHDAGAVEPGQVPSQFAAHLEAGAGVEGGQRFVEEEKTGRQGEGAGEGDALLLASREDPGTVGGAVGQIHALEPRSGPGPRRPPPPSGGAQAVGHVVEGGQVREEQVVLEHDGDGPVLGRHEQAAAGVIEGSAVDLDAAVPQRRQPTQSSQKRGFSCPVGPQEGDRLAVGDRERHVEGERPLRAAGTVDPQTHVAPSHRSRRVNNTATETASTMDRTMAAPGSVSRARYT